MMLNVAVDEANAPPHSRASRKKILKICSLQRSLSGCCSQMSESEATANSSSQSAGLSGEARSVRLSDVVADHATAFDRFVCRGSQVANLRVRIARCR